MVLTNADVDALTHMDTDGEAIGVDLLSSLDVDVLAGSGRTRVEVGVMGGQFAAEGCILCQRADGVHGTFDVPSMRRATSRVFL